MICRTVQTLFPSLRFIGLCHSVQETIMLLAKWLKADTKDMTYEDYVKRIATSGNELAISVKYNDLQHNLTRGRAGGHWKQVAKHERGLALLTGQDSRQSPDTRAPETTSRCRRPGS